MVSRAKLPLIMLFSLIIGVILIYLVGTKFLVDTSTIEISLEATSTLGGVGKQKQVNFPAPYFSLPDLSGEVKKLTDYKDKTVILYFWTTWNQSSRDQLTILNSYYTKVSNDPSVGFLAVNSQEDKSVVSNYIRRGGYTIPVVLDEKGDMGELYRISLLPAIFIIGTDGRVKDTYIGVLNEEAIREMVSKVAF